MQQHCKWLLGCFTAGVVATSCSLVSAQNFDLLLSAPSSVEDAAGSTVQVEVVGRLSSSAIDTEDGAQAWSVGVETNGWTAVGATTNGTAGALDTAGGLRDSSGEDSSFEKTEVIAGGGGVVSAVVLSFNDVVTVPPSGAVDILRITCEATVPELVDEQCEPLVGTAAYVNGLVGSGEPVANRVTYRGESVDPSLGSIETRICPTPPPSESGLIVRPEGGVAVGAKSGGTQAFRVDIPGPADSTDLEISVFLDSQIEPCATEDPAACSGGENFVVVDDDGFIIGYGCSDMMDNDDNGLTDLEDPDCRGVQGWSMSVKTLPCLDLTSATTRGTIGDLNLRPPGLRDPEGNFEKTEIVDPARNDGMTGAVSAVVLSLSSPVIAEQVGESRVLALAGSVDTSGLVNPGDCTDACRVEILPASADGLVGSGEPVKTAVTISGETSNPNICNAEIQVCIAQVQVEEFIRCDPNDDGRQNIADAIWIVNELFVDGAPLTGCQDAADCNDDGLGPDTSDAIYAINYQFFGGDAPPAPFPGCGGDPTDDEITCDTIPTNCQ